MFAPATQQQQKQSEPASSAEEEALKLNTDCVYFLASPLTCKKGAECEYRHSEYARVNPRDCYYWLSGNCMNPKCGFRHPPLEGLLGNQGGAVAGSVQPPHTTAAPCVFFQKSMCVKGDMCSFLHMPNPCAYKKQYPAVDPLFSKKPIESNTGEKKLLGANLSKPAKAHVDVLPAPRVTSAGLRDTRGVVGNEQKKDVGGPSFTQGDHSTQLHQKYGSDDNNSFHNGKDADDVLRESSPGFDVLVDNEEARDSEYYHAEDRYGRRSQEGGNSVNEYDPDKEPFHDHRYDQREDRYAWGHRRVSSERGDRLERRVYAEDERSEDIVESDLRYRLGKQRKVNGMRSVGSHDSSVERGYRDPRRGSSMSSSRLQGRIKLLRERSNGDEAHHFDWRTERGRDRSNGDEAHHFDWRTERGRNRSELSQGRLRDRIKESHSGNHERDFRAPWERRREMEDERKSSFSAPKSIAETKSSKEPPSLGKRKSVEEDHHHHHRHKQSGNAFAAPLPFSEILKRKRAAAASGGSSSSNNKDETAEEEAADETKLEKTEVVSEHKAELEEGRIMEEEEVIGEEVYKGNEEEQAYEGDGEYYYEEGYEEGEEYNYEEGEEVVYAAAEEATEEDIEKKTVVEMLS